MTSNQNSSEKTAPGGLSEKVAHALTEKIIDGVWLPRAFLPTEIELTETFGVSRTVIREATKILVAKGLVDVQRGRGVMVREPASEEVIAQTFSMLLRRRSVTFWHLWQMRVILETEVAGLAALHRVPTHLFTLRQTMLAMEDPNASLENLVDSDMAFHQTLAEAANNPLLELIFQSVTGLMRASRKLTLQQSGAPHALAGHQQIFIAVEEGNAESARAMMRTHLHNVKEDLDSQSATNLVFDGADLL